jgi:hypothetical protein
MLVNEYRLEIQFKKVQKIEILITFQRSGPNHWNVSLRRTYAQNGLYMVFKNAFKNALFSIFVKSGIFSITDSKCQWKLFN